MENLQEQFEIAIIQYSNLTKQIIEKLQSDDFYEIKDILKVREEIFNKCSSLITGNKIIYDFKEIVALDSQAKNLLKSKISQTEKSAFDLQSLLTANSVYKKNLKAFKEFHKS